MSFKTQLWKWKGRISQLSTKNKSSRFLEKKSLEKYKKNIQIDTSLGHPMIYIPWIISLQNIVGKQNNKAVTVTVVTVKTIYFDFLYNSYQMLNNIDSLVSV
jgi:hypothetical protein